MNYQQKIMLLKANEKIELEIDNQLIFIRKPDGSEEIKVLKSLEEAEMYFNQVKLNYLSEGFTEKTGVEFIPMVHCISIKDKLLFIPKIQFKERKYPDEYKSAEPVGIIDLNSKYNVIGEELIKAFTHSKYYESASEKQTLNLETIFPLIDVKDWDEFDCSAETIEISFKKEQYTLTPQIRDNSVQENEENAISCSRDVEKIGEAIVNLINLASEKNPNFIKYTNPNPGSLPGKLSGIVEVQIIRLGGKFNPDKKTQIVIDNFLAPDAIALFYTNSLISKFPRKKFKTDEDNNSTFWVWDMQFEWPGSCKEIPTIDKEGKLLSIIGVADGGNYILAIDLNDPDPSNPRVYKMDHYDPEQNIGDGALLSDFLAELTEDSWKKEH